MVTNDKMANQLKVSAHRHFFESQEAFAWQ